MFGDSDWEKFLAERGPLLEIVQSGAIRIALLFGSTAIAIALLLAPVLDRETRVAGVNALPGIDRMVTGTVPTGKIYTLHRSILQDTPSSVCVIHFNGVRTGDC
ncbi:MAG: hypothetical protein BGN87_10615 [Rhizobiales bacterium 65-79]|jgi:hypothetical protein|nr:hypothetical protein [Hyphomicrobiales bacterium]MBN9077682.1 hypothetical protein [Hyphomicrobiales bacterium]OJU00420.1 MAG: hypothetical protein BGN87_10615 [Rhizobiales bacterium 65-79]